MADNDQKRLARIGDQDDAIDAETAIRRLVDRAKDPQPDPGGLDLRVRDKVSEAEFFLKEMQTAAQEIQGEPSLTASAAVVRFRHTLSAFATAARSITFVMQAVHRHEYGDRFDRWYESKRQLLRQVPLAGALLNIRNVVQKEGNRFPQLRLTLVDKYDNEYAITWNPAIDGPAGIVTYSMSFAPGFRPGFATDAEQGSEEWERLNRDATAEALARGFLLVHSDAFREARRTKIDIIIEDGGQPLPFSEFFAACTEYLRVASSYASEAEQSFPVRRGAWKLEP